MLPLLPPFFECYLSKWDAMLNFLNHYPAMYAGPLFYALILGWARVYPWLKRALPEWSPAVLGVSIAVSLTQLAASEPGGLSKLKEQRESKRCLDRLVDIIPANAGVLALDPVAANLSSRDKVSLPFRWIHLSEDEWKHVDQTWADYFITSDPKAMENPPGLTNGRTGDAKKVAPPWVLMRDDCGLRVFKRSP